MLLLDAGAVLDLVSREGDGHHRLREFLYRHAESRVGTCPAALGPICEGFELGDAAHDVRARVESLVQRLEMLPLDAEVAQAYGRLAAELRRRAGVGHAARRQGLLWVAATALRHGWAVLTPQPVWYIGVPLVRIVGYGQGA